MSLLFLQTIFFSPYSTCHNFFGSLFLVSGCRYPIFYIAFVPQHQVRHKTALCTDFFRGWKHSWRVTRGAVIYDSLRSRAIFLLLLLLGALTETSHRDQHGIPIVWCTRWVTTLSVTCYGCSRELIKPKVRAKENNREWQFSFLQYEPFFSCLSLVEYFFFRFSFLCWRKIITLILENERKMCLIVQIKHINERTSCYYCPFSVRIHASLPVVTQRYCSLVFQRVMHLHKS